MIDPRFIAPLLALTTVAARADAPAAAAADSGPVSSASVDPGDGWRNARWGMTVEEVLRAFPGEAFRLDPELKLADGAVVAVAIDAHEIASHRFQVRFVFEGGRLSLVSLRTPPASYAGPEIYREVAKALSVRHGLPLESTADDSFIDLRQARWMAKGSGVDLKYIPGVVAIVHYPRPAAAKPPPEAAAAPPAEARARP